MLVAIQNILDTKETFKDNIWDADFSDMLIDK